MQSDSTQYGVGGRMQKEKKKRKNDLVDDAQSLSV